MSRRFAAVALVLAATLVGGCRGGGDEAPDDATPDAATSTSTTAPIAGDPAFAVPATIDEAYVGRVLAALDAVQGDVARRIVEAGALSQADVIPLRAVFLDPELRAQTEGFSALVENLDRIRKPPGDNRTTVVRLLTARPDCIYAETTVDVSETVLDPPPPFTSYVALRPGRPGDDPQERNPTPYAIAAEHREARDPCG